LKQPNDSTNRNDSRTSSDEYAVKRHLSAAGTRKKKPVSQGSRSEGVHSRTSSDEYAVKRHFSAAGTRKKKPVSQGSRSEGVHSRTSSDEYAVKRRFLAAGQRGAALIFTIFALMIMMYVASEIVYDTAVDYRVTNSEYKSLRAHYNAKAGIEFSLLRLMIFRQVSNQFKDQQQMTNMIWQFPMAWPLVAPDKSLDSEKRNIEETAGESLIEGSFVTTITPESTKIDINDLAIDNEAYRKIIIQQLAAIIQNALDADTEWARNKRGEYQAMEIANNIADWVDQDSDARNGGSESAPYSPDEYGTDVIYPPNRTFRTIDELHMVAGVDDEIFKLLLPNITLFGSKGILINQAGKDILMAIDPMITEQVADAILERVADQAQGPFKGPDDFYTFLQNQGINPAPLREANLPLVFSEEVNFRISSQGQFQSVGREIIAVTYDFDTVKDRLQKLVTPPDPQAPNEANQDPANPQNPAPANQNPNQSAPPTQESKPAVGRPEVVFWEER